MQRTVPWIIRGGGPMSSQGPCQRTQESKNEGNRLERCALKMEDGFKGKEHRCLQKLERQRNRLTLRVPRRNH